MKKSISLLLVMCIVLCGCGKASTDAATEEIVLKENQSIKYGQVTKINGNELTIALATQVSASEMQSQRGNKMQGTENSDQGSGNKSEGMTEGNPPGDMPGNANGASEQSAGSSQSSRSSQSQSRENGASMPEGAGAPPNMGGNPGEQGSTSGKNNSNSNGGDASSGKQNKGDSSSSTGKGSNKNRVRYQLTGEEEDVTIPVGTKVTTSLGTTTTFSRIAANDTLKLLMEKNDAGEEVIVGVWIVA